METEPVTNEPMESDAMNVEKKSIVLWLAIAGLTLLLAAATYIGGGLINRQPEPDARGNPAMMSVGSDGEMMVQGESESGGQANNLVIEPSADLPDRQPDTNGVFVKRQDYSIFIGTGKITTSAAVNGNNEAETATDFDGPVVEVVVNHESEVMKDVTQPPSNPEASATIQQEIQPGTLDEIGKGSMISVWGRKSGDRFIAETLIYTNPVPLAAPSEGRK